MNQPPRRWRDDPEKQTLADFIGQLEDDPEPAAEARVWARLTRFSARPLWPRVTVGALASATVVALVVVLWSPAPTVMIGAVAHAEVELLVDDQPAGVGDPIAAGVRLHSRAGRSVVRLGQQSGVLLGRSTDVLLEARDLLQLERGSVLAAVRPDPGTSFHVVAGEFDVKVTGTTFRVERPDPHQVRVSVWEGSVAVRGPEGVTEIGAGQSFSSSGGEAAAIAQADLELIRSLVPPGVPDPAVPGESLVDTPNSPDTPATKSKRRVPRDEQAYRAAVATRDPEKAIERFDAIAEGAGSHAEVATYQAARLTMPRRPAEAIQRLEGYLRRYPRGAFDVEVRLSLVELRIKLGHMRTAEQDANAFSKRHPRSERLPELRFLRGNIQRLFHRDCGAALLDYEAALASPRRRNDALYFKGYCLLELGRAAEGRRALEQYLEAAPKGRHADAARERLAR